MDGFARANDDGNAHGMHMECVRVTVIYIYMHAARDACCAWSRARRGLARSGGVGFVTRDADGFGGSGGFFQRRGCVPFHGAFDEARLV